MLYAEIPQHLLHKAEVPPEAHVSLYQFDQHIPRRDIPTPALGGTSSDCRFVNTKEPLPVTMKSLLRVREISYI